MEGEFLKGVIRTLVKKLFQWFMKEIIDLKQVNHRNNRDYKKLEIMEHGYSYNAVTWERWGSRMTPSLYKDDDFIRWQH